MGDRGDKGLAGAVGSRKLSVMSMFQQRDQGTLKFYMPAFFLSLLVRHSFERLGDFDKVTCGDW